MSKYNISCEVWSYDVSTDESGTITECSISPNGGNHWCVNNSIDWLKKQYQEGNIFNVTIKTIK